jgi:hypothetical protein
MARLFPICLTSLCVPPAATQSPCQVHLMGRHVHTLTICMLGRTLVKCTYRPGTLRADFACSLLTSRNGTERDLWLRKLCGVSRIKDITHHGQLASAT